MLSIITGANGLNCTRSNAGLGNITDPELHTKAMKALPKTGRIYIINWFKWRNDDGRGNTKFLTGVHGGGNSIWGCNRCSYLECIVGEGHGKAVHVEQTRSLDW